VNARLGTRSYRAVLAPEFEGIELQHTDRALQFPAEIGPELEAALTRVMTEKLFADATLVLFDTTSPYFEGAGPHELASCSYSRDKRGDRPQAKLALLTSREGLPLGHWLYPGKQSDVRSMAEATREFRARLPLGSLKVVADRGMLSAANLQALQEEKLKFIIAERLRRNTAEEALSRPGRFERVTENLEVKEIKREESERILVCRNLTRAGEDARYERKSVLRTNISLPAEQVALAYRALWRVENAFRTLKTPCDLRPLFHTSEAGVRGHVQACVPAYALARIIEDRLDAAKLDLNAKDVLHTLESIQLVTIGLGSNSIERVSAPTNVQARILPALKDEAPPNPRA